MKHKKNILFLAITLNKGGAERVLSILINKYSKREDLNIHLILLESGISYKLPENINLIVLSKSKKSNYQKLLELPYLAYLISKYTKTNNIDTVISFLYRANYVNIMAKFLNKKPKVVINIRSTTSRYLKEGLLGKINLILIEKLFNKADLIVSNSFGVKKDLENLINITTKHISIPNPIDIKKIEKLRLTEDYKADKLDLSKKYIISVGRLIPLKRNKDLILAFYNILNKIDEDINLLFLGDGILKNDLMDDCKDLNILDRVIFLGNVENPFYFLDKSELFVLTSETEGFPNVLVEAMACYLSVISSNCKSGPSEILGDGKYGLLYDVGDTEQLSDNILTILNNKKLKNKLTKLAFKRSLEYDLNIVIKLFNKAFNI